jgi:hypothetical protein
MYRARNCNFKWTQLQAGLPATFEFDTRTDAFSVPQESTNNCVRTFNM